MELSFLVRLLLAIVVSQKALAYPCPVGFDGNVTRWSLSPEDPKLSYEIVADPEDLYLWGALVDAAAQMWSSVEQSFIELENNAFSPEITIYFENTLDSSDSTSGYSEIDEDENGPMHCSIHILVGSGISPLDFAKTVLHELGHCLGLGHSMIKEAIMSYELDHNHFGLDIDDKAALSRTYPKDGSKYDLPRGCAVGTSQYDNQAVFLLYIVGFALPLVWGRTRKLTKKG